MALGAPQRALTPHADAAAAALPPLTGRAAPHEDASPPDRRAPDAAVRPEGRYRGAHAGEGDLCLGRWVGTMT